jgi:glycosyltransferase involved in cell wall biosynthesis
MVKYKRPGQVIRAVQLAQRQMPDLRLWMIGGGPLLERLRAEAPPGVELLGHVGETTKHDRMARAHVHLTTSVREGWGLVVSEAAALGTPTIAYDVPGLRDSTRAAAGVVVAPNPEAMSRQLIGLLPAWRGREMTPMPYGGAHSWDDVAASVLCAVGQHARVPAIAVAGRRRAARILRPAYQEAA